MPAIEWDNWHTLYPIVQRLPRFSKSPRSCARGEHVVCHNPIILTALIIPCVLSLPAMAKGQGVKLRSVGSHGRWDQAIGRVWDLPQASQHIIHQSLGTALWDEIVWLLMSQHSPERRTWTPAGLWSSSQCQRWVAPGMPHSQTWPYMGNTDDQGPRRCPSNPVGRGTAASAHSGLLCSGSGCLASLQTWTVHPPYTTVDALEGPSIQVHVLNDPGVLVAL